jgi:hypothetical protein
MEKTPLKIDADFFAKANTCLYEEWPRALQGAFLGVVFLAGLWLIAYVMINVMQDSYQAGLNHGHIH